MTHYKMLDRVPSVALTSNRNELKVYEGNIVYLNNGDNFELRLFNPLQRKIGVEIILNGIKKGDSLLVLNPGQDLTLDRFLDEQRKMVFETYTVNGDSKEAMEAIAKNGLIQFNFYNEYYYSDYNKNIEIKYAFPPKLPKSPKHYKFNANKRVKGPSGVQGPSGCAGTFTSSVTPTSFGSTTTTAVYNTTSFNSPGIYTNEMDFSYKNCSNYNNTIYFSNDYYIPSTNNVSSTHATTLPSLNQLETGRVEMGDYSNQGLKRVNASFATLPFHTLTYQILPISSLNRTLKEVRVYCTSCGYRLRKESWQFCPHCGSKVQ